MKETEFYFNRPNEPKITKIPPRPVPPKPEVEKKHIKRDGKK